MQRFDVSVVTGDKECAGTDANVFINLIGSLGKENGIFLLWYEFDHQNFNPDHADWRSEIIKKGCSALNISLLARNVALVCSSQPEIIVFSIELIVSGWKKSSKSQI